MSKIKELDATNKEQKNEMGVLYLVTKVAEWSKVVFEQVGEHRLTLPPMC